MSLMKFSIITVVYNRRAYIAHCIESVLMQDYPHVEYIIVDGGSTDGTLEVVRAYGTKIARVISEKDEGIYDALNKGIALATGEVIGILNSDDFYVTKDVLSSVAKRFEETGADAVWGDLEYVEPEKPESVVRRWKSSPFKRGSFAWGWMPPHPTFFARRSVYERFGSFRKDMKIGADFEIMLRFLERYGMQGAYLPKTLIRMRFGGASNVSPYNILRANIESYRAFKLNGLPANPLSFLLKPFSKIKHWYRSWPFAIAVFRALIPWPKRRK